MSLSLYIQVKSLDLSDQMVLENPRRFDTFRDYKKDGGTATIFGQDVWEDSLSIHERLSYVPGDISLWGNLTGGAIIDLFMKLHGKGVLKKDELIQRFSLDPKKKQKLFKRKSPKSGLDCCFGC